MKEVLFSPLLVDLSHNYLRAFNLFTITGFFECEKIYCSQFISW